jgi:hypothetical protein
VSEKFDKALERAEENLRNMRDPRDAEIERLRLALGESEAIRRVLEESELTKRFRELAAEKDCYLRERNQAEAEVARLRAELAAYQKAKAENDERFQIERDEARNHSSGEEAHVCGKGTNQNDEVHPRQTRPVPARD